MAESSSGSDVIVHSLYSRNVGEHASRFSSFRKRARRQSNPCCETFIGACVLVAVLSDYWKLLPELLGKRNVTEFKRTVERVRAQAGLASIATRTREWGSMDGTVLVGFAIARTCLLSPDDVEPLATAQEWLPSWPQIQLIRFRP